MLNKKLELENIFANDFQTPHFFSLAEIYFHDNDFKRASIVCEIGLKTHGTHLEARYMLAKIYLLNNQIIKSEKFLSKSFNENLISPQMLKLFIEIRDSLNRSISETKKIVDQLLELEHDDIFANRWIHNYQQKNTKVAKPKNELTFKINQNIVSYTFYDVLKKQKYYNQAELVLDMLKNSDKIKSTVYQKEHKIISDLLNS